jgi:hypothetical protein
MWFVTWADLFPASDHNIYWNRNGPGPNKSSPRLNCYTELQKVQLALQIEEVIHK